MYNGFSIIQRLFTVQRFLIHPKSVHCTIVFHSTKDCPLHYRFSFIQRLSTVQRLSINPKTIHCTMAFHSSRLSTVLSFFIHPETSTVQWFFIHPKTVHCTMGFIHLKTVHCTMVFHSSKDCSLYTGFSFIQRLSTVLWFPSPRTMFIHTSHCPLCQSTVIHTPPYFFHLHSALNIQTNNRKGIASANTD